MDLLNQIYDAGIVGCGGAGFPTHVKLKGNVEYLLLNGAECEPLLRTDRYIMINEADKVVRAAQAVKDFLGAKECRIALKQTYTTEAAALEKAIKSQKSKVKLHRMQSFYPAGDEQMIVYEATGRVVPPGGIPLDVGCVVSNIATMFCIAEAMESRPFTQKYLTVTGEVHTPSVLKVPLGTSFTECIRLAGGAKKDRYFIISGGPMMGKPLTMEQAGEAVVTKTTSGILVLPETSYLAMQNEITVQHMLNRARSACIQCSYCTQMCPRHLIGHPLKPHKIMRKMAIGRDVSQLLEDKDIQNAAICCECGICEQYACPMGLQPRRVNALLKGELRKAGIRYTREDKTWTADPNREDRKAPTKRVAARVGVMAWYDYDVQTFTEGRPDCVSIPVQMHIGAPSVPVVKPGDAVTCGQLIADCREGSLGAKIHASIDGTVKAVGDKITIERNG